MSVFRGPRRLWLALLVALLGAVGGCELGSPPYWRPGDPPHYSPPARGVTPAPPRPTIVPPSKLPGVPVTKTPTPTVTATATATQTPPPPVSAPPVTRMQLQSCRGDTLWKRLEASQQAWVEPPAKDLYWYPANKEILITWANWFPLDGSRQVLCGRMKRCYIHPRGTEQDRNLVMRPSPGRFAALIEDAKALVKNTKKLGDLERELEKGCDPGAECLEAEITPAEDQEAELDGQLDCVDERPAPRTFMLSRDLCVSGPWVRERAHNFKPEIHPIEVAWWRDGSALRLYTFQDASERFVSAGHYYLPQEISAFPADWSPWTKPPERLALQVSFTASATAGQKTFHYETGTGGGDRTLVTRLDDLEIHVQGDPSPSVTRPEILEACRDGDVIRGVLGLSLPRRDRFVLWEDGNRPPAPRARAKTPDQGVASRLEVKTLRVAGRGKIVASVAVRDAQGPVQVTRSGLKRFLGCGVADGAGTFCEGDVTLDVDEELQAGGEPPISLRVRREGWLDRGVNDETLKYKVIFEPLEGSFTFAEALNESLAHCELDDPPGWCSNWRNGWTLTHRTAPHCRVQSSARIYGNPNQPLGATVTVPSNGAVGVRARPGRSEGLIETVGPMPRPCYETGRNRWDRRVEEAFRERVVEALMNAKLTPADQQHGLEMIGRWSHDPPIPEGDTARVRRLSRMLRFSVTRAELDATVFTNNENLGIVRSLARELALEYQRVIRRSIAAARTAPAPGR